MLLVFLRAMALRLGSAACWSWPNFEDGDGEDDEKDSQYFTRTAPQLIDSSGKTVLCSQKMAGG